MYPTLESVKMENKFAPVDMKLPLIEDPEKALKSVKI